MSLLRLPLAAPLVRSHLFHAFPLAILATRGEAALPWILSTFVQLYQLPEGDLKFYVHAASPAVPLDRVVLTTCPWLQVQALDPGLLKESPCAFLRRCLRRGLYPQVDVDHGRLPWDGRRGYVHEVLVRGAGDDRFEVLGYDRAGRFGVRHLAAADLESGLLDAGGGPNLGLPDGALGSTSGEEGPHPGPRGGVAAQPPGVRPWAGRPTPPAVPPRPRWFLYGLTRGDGFRLDVAAVAEQLWDYVDAADSSRRHRALWPVAAGAWGVAAVTQLADNLSTCGATALVPLRVLGEHKHLMALRLAHLEAAGHLDPDLGTAAAARRLSAQTWRLRLAVLRALRPAAHSGPGAGDALAAGARETLEAAADDARRIVARDIDLCSRVLNHLDGTGLARTA